MLAEVWQYYSSTHRTEMQKKLKKTWQLRDIATWGLLVCGTPHPQQKNCHTRKQYLVVS